MAIDKYREDKFDPDDFDDYKMAWVEKERLRQENSENGWIYVGMDSRSDDRAKVGLTKNGLATRASSSHNPDYMPYCGFKIKEGVSREAIRRIEAETICELERRFARIKHKGSGKVSEWFMASPGELREACNEFLSNHHSSSMDGYHCFDRDMNVVKSWENDRVLRGGENKPFEASDLSNPPVAFECYMPGGCGAADCDCFE